MNTDQKFVIVLGFPRSGTTLLRQILDAHPEISCPPEPWLSTACAKFIREVPATGPGIGVLSGLSFSGIETDEIVDSLRALFERMHIKIANGKRVCVEKSGFDIFYLDELESIFSQHCKFICLSRNPLDVIPSIKNLTEEMGIYMPELHPYIQANATPLEAYAEAWAKKTQDLIAFTDRNQSACFSYRFEDLLDNPTSVLDPLMSFLGVEKMDSDTLENAFKGDIAIGLGDWKVYEKTGLDSGMTNQWRKKIPRETLGKILPVLSEGMTHYGYDLPKAPKIANRKKSVEQFKTIMTMRRNNVVKNKE